MLGEIVRRVDGGARPLQRILEEGLFPMPFGATASPRTFGGLGAGSRMFCVDPERDLVFVCLTTGILEDSRHFERTARLSDLALAAIVD